MSENEPKTLIREVEVGLQREGDGRTLISRLVPYNKVATVADVPGQPYEEMFVPGAFKAQMRAAHRIKAFLNFRHRQGLQDQIGFAKSIDDKDDGLYGELRVLEGEDGDKALQLIDAEMLDKLSIEFQPIKDRVVNGVVHRIAARLVGVALAPVGAYPGAQVLAVREAVDEEAEEEPTSTLPHLRPPDPGVLEIAARFVPIPEVFREVGSFDPELAEHSARFVDVPEELGGTPPA